MKASVLYAVFVVALLVGVGEASHWRGDLVTWEQLDASRIQITQIASVRKSAVGLPVFLDFDCIVGGGKTCTKTTEGAAVVLQADGRALDWKADCQFVGSEENPSLRDTRFVQRQRVDVYTISPPATMPVKLGFEGLDDARIGCLENVEEYGEQDTLFGFKMVFAATMLPTPRIEDGLFPRSPVIAGLPLVLVPEGEPHYALPFTPYSAFEDYPDVMCQFASTEDSHIDRPTAAGRIWEVIGANGDPVRCAFQFNSQGTTRGEAFAHAIEVHNQYGFAVYDFIIQISNPGSPNFDPECHNEFNTPFVLHHRIDPFPQSAIDYSTVPSSATIHVIERHAGIHLTPSNLMDSPLPITHTVSSPGSFFIGSGNDIEDGTIRVAWTVVQDRNGVEVQCPTSVIDDCVFNCPRNMFCDNTPPNNSNQCLCLENHGFCAPNLDYLDGCEDLTTVERCGDCDTKCSDSFVSNFVCDDTSFTCRCDDATPRQCSEIGLDRCIPDTECCETCDHPFECNASTNSCQCKSQCFATGPCDNCDGPFVCNGDSCECPGDCDECFGTGPCANCAAGDNRQCGNVGCECRAGFVPCGVTNCIPNCQAESNSRCGDSCTNCQTTLGPNSSCVNGECQCSPGFTLCGTSGVPGTCQPVGDTCCGVEPVLSGFNPANVEACSDDQRCLSNVATAQCVDCVPQKHVFNCVKTNVGFDAGTWDVETPTECEADADDSHCGGCAQDCTDSGSEHRVCHDFGSTQPGGFRYKCLCSQSYGDCNNGNQNWGDDGCETYLDDNNIHCGACGIECENVETNGGFEFNECADGVCTTCERKTIPADRAPFFNCDLDQASGTLTFTQGCEASSWENDSCNSCDNECKPGTTCQDMAGRPACAPGPMGTGCLCPDPTIHDTCGNGYDPQNTGSFSGVLCGTDLTETHAHCSACDCPCTDDEYCTAGICEECPTGLHNCEPPIPDTCTTSKTDPQYCGTCSNDCGVNTVCNFDGVSTYTCACLPGWFDCDAGVLGCETDISSDPLHCGECDQACDFNVENLWSGQCVAGSCEICADNKISCSTSCDTFISDTQCAKCSGNDCPAQFLGPQSGRCQLQDDGWHCVDCQEKTFQGGRWANCQPSTTMSCETDLNTDINNCGECSNSCSPGSQVCLDGTCVAAPQCPEGEHFCDGACHPLWSSAFCGSCAVDCLADETSDGECIAGEGCRSCPGSFSDCNNDITDRCETNTNSNNNHCGACGAACPANSNCVSGVCTCKNNWRNCNGSDSAVTDPLDTDGCETERGVYENCSDCGDNCLGSQTCDSFVCTCEGGTGACHCDDNDDCPSGDCNLSTGFCECGGAVLSSDPSNCGSCGHACHNTEVCSSGNCVCAPGRGDCNNHANDGCETDLTDDVFHCGHCDFTCPSPGFNTCEDGSCTFDSFCDSEFCRFCRCVDLRDGPTCHTRPEWVVGTPPTCFECCPCGGSNVDCRDFQ